MLCYLFAVLCLGCSQNVHVSGTVTYEDGSPVQFGSVKFETEAYQFEGIIKDGVYDAGVKKQGQGIPPGTYKVWLGNTTRTEVLINAAGQEVQGQGFAVPQITEEFTRPGKSPLSLEVKRGSGRITYDIVVKHCPGWDKQQKYQKKEGADAVDAGEIKKEREKKRDNRRTKMTGKILSQV